MAQSVSADLSQVREITAHWRTDNSASSSRASDISSAGAFISTTNPPPAGTTIRLRLEAAGREIALQAVVRRVIAGEGMGVEFDSIAPEDRASLESMVREAEKPNAEPASDSKARTVAHPERHRLRVRNSPERRSRARYKFSAPAEITESDTERMVSGELSNLGHFGCYVKIADPFAAGASLKIAIKHNGQCLKARAAVRSSQPQKGMGLIFTDLDDRERKILDEWLTVSSERAWLATNRRRGQRVVVSIPVEVEAKDRWGRERREETKTISVSANGALLALEMELTKGQTITLRDPSSREALECSVDYLGSSQQGRREVGVSFVQPDKCLWRIAFPPADWSIEDPYAKGS